MKKQRTGIDGTKVPLDTAKLLFVDQMKEARFKFTDFARRGGHTHGLLTSSEENMIFRLGNDGIVHGTIGSVRFQMLEIDGIVQFRGKVGGRRDEQSLLSIEAQSIDFLFVRREFLLDVARFWVVQTYLSIVKGHEQVFIQ